MGSVASSIDAPRPARPEQQQVHACMSKWLTSHPSACLVCPCHVCIRQARVQVILEILGELLAVLHNPNNIPTTSNAPAPAPLPLQLPLGRAAVLSLWAAYGATLEPLVDRRDSTSLHCW